MQKMKEIVEEKKEEKEDKDSTVQQPREYRVRRLQSPKRRKVAEEARFPTIALLFPRIYAFFQRLLQRRVELLDRLLPESRASPGSKSKEEKRARVTRIKEKEDGYEIFEY